MFNQYQKLFIVFNNGFKVDLLCFYCFYLSHILNSYKWCAHLKQVSSTEVSNPSNPESRKLGLQTALNAHFLICDSF